MLGRELYMRLPGGSVSDGQRCACLHHSEDATVATADGLGTMRKLESWAGP